MKLKSILIMLGISIFLQSCDNKEYSHYIDNNNPHKKEIEQLFPLLDKYQEYSENRFTVMSKIITKMIEQNNPGKLNLLITTYVNENVNDPYNSYYLLNLASYYLNTNQVDFAIPILHQSVMNYNDLIIRGESTHFKALEILINRTKDKDYKVFYYKKLIQDHEERVEKRDVFQGGIGELYYYLGKTLEENEKLDEAIIEYEKFLKYPNSTISKSESALDETIRKVGFYHSEKNWVVKDLDQLVKNVKYAIATRSSVLLDKYRAFDFFIINWNSDYSDLKSKNPLESYVLSNMSIKTARDLDPMSTENEAYLAVSGNPWSSSIWYVYPTWYFYFRKIDYPMDPEINGGWEWAGIFLGEKL